MDELGLGEPELEMDWRNLWEPEVEVTWTGRSVSTGAVT